MFINLYIKGDVRFISRTADQGLCIDLDCVKQARENNRVENGAVEAVKTATIYEQSTEHKLLTPKRAMIPTIPLASVSGTYNQEKSEEKPDSGEENKRDGLEILNSEF